MKTLQSERSGRARAARRLVPATLGLATLALAFGTLGAQQSGETPASGPGAGQGSAPEGREAGSAKDGPNSWKPKKVGDIDLTKVRVAPEAAPETAKPGPGKEMTVPFSDVKRRQGQELPDGPKARIEIESGTDTFDFGELSEGEAPSHTFRLKAAGEADLIIHRIRASCGCTLAQTAVVTAGGERRAYKEGTPIPPGSELEVEVTLKTQSKTGDVATSVALHSNDEEFAVRRLNLKAKVQPMLRVDPLSVNFGHLTPNVEKEEKISITSTQGTPMRVWLEEDTTRGEELEVELVPLDPDADGRSAGWEARLKLGKGAPEGIKNYPMAFKTDLPLRGAEAAEGAEVATYEFRAYAMAQVQGLVSAKPAYTAFGMMRPGETATRTFVLETKDEEYLFPAEVPVRVVGLRDESFEFPDNVEVTAVTSPDRTQVDVEIKVFDLPEDFQGSFGGFVELEVDHPTREVVKARFSGSCKPGVVTPASPAGGGSSGGSR